MKEKDYLADIGRMVLPHMIRKLEHYAKKRLHENRQDNQYDTDNYSWLRLTQQKEIMQECFSDCEKEADFTHVDILEAIVNDLTEKDCKEIYDTFWTFILSDCSDKELQMFRVSQIAKTYEVD
ncbi:MAG TPA: hypothetical protein DCM40_09470 [Maribacter sp.]|nr:hypothetical protein [Maribacter sp.]